VVASNAAATARREDWENLKAELDQSVDELHKTYDRLRARLKEGR
jgi:hypothetical protein